MTQEKFNDAMVRLRKAEEDLNKALQDVYTAIDAAELKKFQENDDESYHAGLKDMHEAIRTIAADESDGGMSRFELNDAFGTTSVLDIILGYPSEEIMNKVLERNTKGKASQDQELHVGDEKALQDVAIAINEVERKPQKVQEYNDKDLNEAIHIIAAEDGMSVSELNDAFGICSICDILLEFTPEEIIDKVLKWKTKQKKEEKEDQELHVGDEIEYTYPGRKPEKCIVIGLENGIGKEKIIWTIDLEFFRLSWFSSNCYWNDTYHKTGKHYDSIPLNKEEINK